jgi:hypothetical protein
MPVDAARSGRGVVPEDASGLATVKQKGSKPEGSKPKGSKSVLSGDKCIKCVIA